MEMKLFYLFLLLSMQQLEDMDVMLAKLELLVQMMVLILYYLRKILLILKQLVNHGTDIIILLITE